MYRANLLSPVLSWESQVTQYSKFGPPGISYFAGETEAGTVDCLLYRSTKGLVIGILNHYPIDFPPWEKAGNVNIWVHPEHQRRGVGSKLWKEACARWDITLDGQRFTESGAALANALAEEGFA